MNKRITNQKSIYWFQWSSAGKILPHRTLVCRPDCLIVDNPRSLIIFNHYRPQPISLQNKKKKIKKKYKIQRSPVSSWLAKIERVSWLKVFYILKKDCCHVFQSTLLCTTTRKKENHRPKEVYLKAVSCLHQRNFTETFSVGIERGTGRNDSRYHSFPSLSGY